MSYPQLFVFITLERHLVTQSSEGSKEPFCMQSKFGCGFFVLFFFPHSVFFFGTRCATLFKGYEWAKPRHNWPTITFSHKWGRIPEESLPSMRSTPAASRLQRDIKKEKGKHQSSTAHMRATPTIYLHSTHHRPC